MFTAHNAPTVDRQAASPEPSALERWEMRTEWPLAAVALIFLGIYSVQVLLEPPADAHRLLSVVNTVLYMTFVGDYIMRLTLADRRGRWFFGHLFDLAIVILPFLRPLRLLRLVMVFKVTQGAAGNMVRGRVIAYAACSSILLIYISSLAVLSAERHQPGADITSFGNSLWWAVTTVTTVGYGDEVPVTVTGRVAAAFLMVGGISLLGVITATLASWIIQRVAEASSENQAATKAQIDILRADLNRLTEALETDRGRPFGESTQAPPGADRARLD
ncbi:MAG: potassium channel family protein [Actinomycetia bacterium]|nr:potassium channel family protein [Actinomycetes bacterium]